jgi:hypothetical protein
MIYINTCYSRGEILRRWLCLGIFVFFSHFITLYAQSPDSNWQKKIYYRQTAFSTGLGTWAVANIGGGLILSHNYAGHDKYFHQMNAAWNTVNLGLAIGGIFSSRRMMKKEWSTVDLVSANNRMRELLIFNAGLDLAYIATGFYLRERSVNSLNNRDRLSGYGSSLILQGAFLFLFDLSFYFTLPNSKVMLMPGSHGGQPGLGLIWHLN